jgi:hypothetical protein
LKNKSVRRIKGCEVFVENISIEWCNIQGRALVIIPHQSFPHSLPVWDEEATMTKTTSINETDTHNTADFVGNDTIIDPDTGEAINISNTGHGIVTEMNPVLVYGRENVFADDDNILPPSHIMKLRSTIQLDSERWAFSLEYLTTTTTTQPAAWTIQWRGSGRNIHDENPGDPER